MRRRIKAATLLAMGIPLGWGCTSGGAARPEPPPTPATAPATRPVELPAGARGIYDIAYVPGGHARQKLDLYLPPNGEKVPLVIWVHGGGWRGGDKAHPPALRLLERGYAVASVNYRFSNHATFPAQMHDLKAAVRWLRAHADEYHYDANRFAAWGFSAGGQMVALLGVSGGVAELEGQLGEHLDQSSRVQCVIDWAGASEFRDAERLPLNDNRIKLLGGTAAEKPELARLASAVAFVSPDDPPTLIMQGALDKTVDPEHSRRFFAALQAGGVKSKLVEIADGGHGGDKFYTPEMQAIVDAWLDEHLKK